MITGNKGEWSEIYALFKILGEQKLFAGDADLNKVENLFYPIIKIISVDRQHKVDISVTKQSYT
jgi:type II restriction enzyme